MAQQRAWMLAIVSLAANLATRMSQLAATVWRILHLAAKAEIVLWRLSARTRYLTRNAAPLARISLGSGDPRLDAVQVDNVEAVRATPGRVMAAHKVTANHALELVVLDVFY